MVPTAIVATPSSETEIYGLASPQSESSPFADFMFDTVDTTFADLSEVENPFTVSIPAVAMSAANPFTASAPITRRTMSQSVAVPAVEEDEDFAEESTKPPDQLPIYMLVGVVLLPLLILIGVGISNSGGGGSSGGGSRVASDAGGGGNRIETALDRSMAILQQSSDIQTEFVFNMRSPETMRNAARRFNNLDISSLPAGFQFTHRRLGSAMTALADASIEVERTSNLPRTEHIRALDRRQRAHDNFMAALNEYSLAFERRDWMR